MENLKEAKEIEGYQNALPVSAVLTGKAEDKGLMERLSSIGNTSTFVQIPEENLITEFKNFNFKAMHPAINFAQQHGHDIVIGVDAEFNKMAVAVRKDVSGAFLLLNVHQLAVLLTDALINKHQGEELVFVKSNHITDMVDKIADKLRIEAVSKVIPPGKLPDVVNELYEIRGNASILGFTENQEFYYNAGGLEALVERIVEMEKQLRSTNQTLFDKLISLYKHYGFYKEKTFVVDFIADSQRKHILQIIESIRKNPAVIQERLSVLRVTDYKKGKSKNLISQNITSIGQSGFNILKLEMENGASITFAPGEDKMYYHIGIKEGFRDKENFAEANRNFDEYALHIMQIINKL